MSIIVNNIVLSPDDSESKALEIARKKIGHCTQNLKIRRKSIDTRKVDNIRVVWSVEAQLDNDKQEQMLCKKNTCFTYKKELKNEVVLRNTPNKSPVVVGFGPAGMFAALALSQEGYAPIVLERGSEIERRTALVENFWCGNGLSQSNVQFGEGGAGTFSDGKLTTGINDPLCSSVLDTFVKMGADKSILTAAKPHIGTDTLRRIVKNIRNEIENNGGKVLFDTKVTDIVIKNDIAVAVKTSGGDFETDRVLLAIGHSARDTQKMLLKKGLTITPKPFSAGVRLEQLQKNVDIAMYGKFAGHPQLPPAEYKLSYRNGERGVYSFCMCPGGYVVGAASEDGGVVTNGMSYSGRDAINANAAIVVSVLPTDFSSVNPLSGAEFQRKLEVAAFEAGGKNFCAPVQKTKDFIDDRVSTSFSAVKPTYRPGTKFCDINTILPAFISNMLKSGFAKFDAQRRNFNCTEGIITGVETRTSSPIRIDRDENRMAKGFHGIYPIGEGAGYAGGIMSAACDGLKTAYQIFSEEN